MISFHRSVKIALVALNSVFSSCSAVWSWNNSNNNNDGFNNTINSRRRLCYARNESKNAEGRRANSTFRRYNTIKRQQQWTRVQQYGRWIVIILNEDFTVRNINAKTNEKDSSNTNVREQKETGARNIDIGNNSAAMGRRASCYEMQQCAKRQRQIWIINFCREIINLSLSCSFDEEEGAAIGEEDGAYDNEHAALDITDGAIQNGTPFDTRNTKLVQNGLHHDGKCTNVTRTSSTLNINSRKKKDVSERENMERNLLSCPFSNNKCPRASQGVNFLLVVPPQSAKREGERCAISTNNRNRSLDHERQQQEKNSAAYGAAVASTSNKKFTRAKVMTMSEMARAIIGSASSTFSKKQGHKPGHKSSNICYNGKVCFGQQVRVEIVSCDERKDYDGGGTPKESAMTYNSFRSRLDSTLAHIMVDGVVGFCVMCPPPTTHTEINWRIDDRNIAESGNYHSRHAFDNIISCDDIASPLTYLRDSMDVLRGSMLPHMMFRNSGAVVQLIDGSKYDEGATGENITTNIVLNEQQGKRHDKMSMVKVSSAVQHAMDAHQIQCLRSMYYEYREHGIDCLVIKASQLSSKEKFWLTHGDKNYEKTHTPLQQGLYSLSPEIVLSSCIRYLGNRGEVQL